MKNNEIKDSNEHVVVMARPGPPHHCKLPGFFARSELGVIEGTVIKCKECGHFYIWEYDDGGFGQYYWRKFS